MSSASCSFSALAAASALLSATWGTVAWAAPCGRPDIDLTFPPDAASSVPPNAVLSAHYGAPALYADEPVALTDSAHSPVSVTISYDEADSILRATPDQPLSQGAYEVAWPGLRGVSGGGLGQGRTTRFTVSGAEDALPPMFAGLSGIDWDLSRDKDPCLDKLEDRFVFRLQVGAGSDDAGTQLLALNVFQTRDPLAPEQTQPSQVALRAWPANGEIEVRRPASKAGQTCFAALAQDLRGNPSGGGEREVCVTTKMPPFFEGCAFSRIPRSAPFGAGFRLWLGVLGLGLLRRGLSAKSHAARAR